MPEEDEFYVQLALTLLKRERAAEARNYLATAAGIDRKNGNIPYLLGVTFVEKQPDKALGYLRTADRAPETRADAAVDGRGILSLKPRSTPSTRRNPSRQTLPRRRRVARSSVRDGQYPEALLDLDQALRIRGANAGLWPIRRGLSSLGWQGADPQRAALLRRRCAPTGAWEVVLPHRRASDRSGRFRQAMRSLSLRSV